MTAPNTCECPLADAVFDRFGLVFPHRPSCEYSPYFALGVEEEMAQRRYDAGEPKGHGDPTNPQWPDKGDR